MFTRLTDRVSVAGQLHPAQIAEAAQAGFASVVNNRPDDEEPGQPGGDAIAAAAQAAGLTYIAIPVGHAGMTMTEVAAMADALADAAGPVLAFCRSGTRSTHLWALAEATRGGDPAALIAAAASAGYDIRMLRGALAGLAGAQ